MQKFRITGRALILMLVCITAFALAGCREKLTSEEELIAKAREEITVAEAETIETRLAAKQEKK